MSIRKDTPCNYGECPYNAEYSYTCEYYCGEEEPEDNYEEDYDGEEEDYDGEEEYKVQKKLIIKGRWNKPIQFGWKGDLISTLRAANDWTIENDCSGYFFEIENSDIKYMKDCIMPMFVNSYGVLIAPCDYMLEER